MNNDVIVSRIPLGTLAALLTALEYVLSTISALCARAAIHGIWLVGLHRGGTAPFDEKHRTWRSVRKDILTTILGVWLVIGVALVEASLRTSVRVRDDIVDSDKCVSVFGKYNPLRVEDMRPPYRTTVEPWVMTVAQSIACGNRGIASVGVGGTTDIAGNKEDLFGPTCAQDEVDLAKDNVEVSLTIIEIGDTYLKLEYEHSNVYQLLPHNATGLGKDEKSVGLRDEGKGPCGERQISSYYARTDVGFETLSVTSANVSYAVHQKICTLHGEKPIQVLSNDVISECVDVPDGKVQIDCARQKARNDQVFHVEIEDVNALFVGMTIDDPAYACTSAIVRVEYIFMHPKLINDAILADKGKVQYPAQFPVIIPVKVRALSGHCERTIAPLGNAALIYNADAEYRKDALMDLDRKTRYYAHMMAVSSSQFPLHTITGEESATANGKCLVHLVDMVTEIPKDWRLALLFAGLGTTAIVIIAGIGLRIFFNGESWRIGSAQWSLSRLLDEKGNGEKKTAVVEVVAVEASSSSLERDANALVPRRTQRLLIRKGSIPAPDGLFGSLSGPPSTRAEEKQYVYRFRTLDSSVMENNNASTASRTSSGNSSNSGGGRHESV